MSEGSSKPERTRGRQLALWAGGLVSLAYAALIVWMISHPSVCGTHPEGKTLFVGCLTINEIGDFLAGVFAPLAFLWLVIAVIVQSQELSEQRKELALTRKEFEQNRDVAKAQAEESRKQAEYIGKQTEILEEERLRQRRADGDHDVNTQTIHLVDWYSENLNSRELHYFVSGERHVYQLDYLVFPNDRLKSIASISAVMHLLANHVMSLDRTAICRFDDDAQYHLEGLYSRVNSIAEVKEVSSVWRHNFEVAELEALIDSISVIVLEPENSTLKPQDGFRIAWTTNPPSSS